MYDDERARRDQLVTTHVPVVHALVREVAARVPASVDRADLTSAGLIALVQSAHTYDADRGVPFGAYLRTRVRGALLDELRSYDWASRSVRRVARDIEEVRNRMAVALGRTPDAAAVAEALGVTVDVVHRSTEDLARAVVTSIDDEGGAARAAVLPSAEPGPEAALERREQLELVADAVEELPERLRLVVRGYFLEERPMTELAVELGVTESRVSQLRAEAMVLLRAAFADAFDERPAGDAPPRGVAAARRAAYVASVSSRNARRRPTAPSLAPALRGATA